MFLFLTLVLPSRKQNENEYDQEIPQTKTADPPMAPVLKPLLSQILRYVVACTVESLSLFFIS